MLIHTDLPEPVAPATRTWGILVMSQRMTSPPASRPKGVTRWPSVFLYPLSSSKPRSNTGLVFLFGISTPIAGLPGIGASILTEVAARLRAMSSARFTIRLTLTPGPGASSYLVIVGPVV